MAGPEIRFIGDLQRLVIGPDDRFVLTADQVVSDQTSRSIQEHWQRFAGAGVPLLILERGMKLGAINVRVDPLTEDQG